MSLFQLAHILTSTFLLHYSYALDPFESIPGNIASKWTIQGPADLATLIHLRIALVNAKDAEFEDHATKIATPFSGQYRRYLTGAELAEWTDLDAGGVRKVQEWLEEYGVNNSEQDHDLIKAVATIKQAQDLLNTTFSSYQDSNGHLVQRTQEYYIPSRLTPLIELVHPTVNFPSSNRHHHPPPAISTPLRHPRALSNIDLDLASNLDDPCDSHAMTPACTNKLYNATYHPPYSSNITMANAGSGNRVNRTNLKQYLEKFNPKPLKREPYLVESYVGGSSFPIDGQFAFEDQLLEMMMGSGGTLAGEMLNIIGDDGAFEWGPVKHNGNFNHTAVKAGEEGYVDFLHHLSHTSSLHPTVIADASYDSESDLSPKYMRYICKVLGRVSSRGITFLQQVDDYGSGAYPRNGKVVFESAFPSTCPWVSGVGTTVWDRKDGVEKATTWATRGMQAPGLAALSSGLFSQTFERPKWQDKFVQPYLNKFKLSETYRNGSQMGGIVTTGFNPLGRALPDFSVFGARIPTTVNGTVTVTNSAVYGAPIAAGFIARLNAYEQSKGRPLLGSLNPFFYSRPDLFTDITCCGTNSIMDAFPTYKKYAKVNPYGFPVAEGWDAVTGLGSLKFAKILQALDDMAVQGALD